MFYHLGEVRKQKDGKSKYKSLHAHCNLLSWQHTVLQQILRFKMFRKERTREIEEDYRSSESPQLKCKGSLTDAVDRHISFLDASVRHVSISSPLIILNLLTVNISLN